MSELAEGRGVLGSVKANSVQSACFVGGASRVNGNRRLLALGWAQVAVNDHEALLQGRLLFASFFFARASSTGRDSAFLGARERKTRDVLTGVRT